jgi:hypothetical protein
MVIVANFCSETQAPQGAEIIILELALLFFSWNKNYSKLPKNLFQKIFLFFRGDFSGKCSKSSPRLCVLAL